MTGKTVLITGASAGIGKATASELAARGARVAMLCRDPKKAEAARAELLARTPKAQLDLFELDLCSLASVRRCAQQLLSAYPRIDVLLNNAGVFPPTLRHTADGFEEQIGVNHLGHFLLTNLLLERLTASAPARVVTVSSMMHAGGKIDFESFRTQREYSSWAAYRQSKLANILFSNELARRVPAQRVTSNSLHPGGVATEIARDANLFMRLGMRLVGASPEKGARTSVQLASDPALATTTGKYFVSGRQKATDPAADDAALARRLWDESAKLVGLA
ncbi:MAG TPA: SDR family oxidoreductase [Myxococcota bacterium]|nr:SDR family oxidoreductase [Myxococcota bacterium]